METKKFILIMPLILLMATWVIGQGCGSKSNPTTPPPADTKTFTPTTTSTATTTPNLTATQQVIQTATAQAQATQTQVAIATATYQAQATQTQVAIPTATYQEQATQTQVAIATATYQEQATETQVAIPTATYQAQATQTQVAIPTATYQEQATQTQVAIATATNQAQATQTQIAIPTATYQEQATQTQVAIATATYQEQATETQVAIPTATYQEQATQTQVAIATATYQEQATETQVAIPTATYQEQATETQVAIPTATYQEQATQTQVAIATATYQAQATQTQIAIPTATYQEQATQTQVAIATATYQEQATQTAQAQATATQQVRATETAIPNVTDITGNIDGACITDDTTNLLDHHSETIGSINYGSGAPDIAYSFTLLAPQNLFISLCTSNNFDSVLYVRTNETDPNTTIAFDDDSASCGNTSSSLATGVLPAGTYYVVVDGNTAGDFGPFTLCLTTFKPACTLTPVAVPVPLGTGTTDLGTVTTDAVGTGHIDWNFEYTNSWTFTPGAAGNFVISLDCFDDGTGKVLAAYDLYDSTGTLAACSAGNTPLDQQTVSLTAQQYTVVVYAFSENAPSGDYHLVIQATAQALNTPTPVPAICYAPSIQTTYTFATSTDCWHSDPYGGTNVNVNSINISTAQVDYKIGSTGALAINVTNPSTTNTGTLQMEVDYGTAQDFEGGTIEAYIYCDGSLGNTGAQLFDQSVTAVGGTSATYPMETSWTNITGGQWIKMTMVTSGSGGKVDTHNVSRVGFQVPGIAPGATGNIYIDAVTIKPYCMAPSIQSTYTFETSEDCWYPFPANGAPASVIIAHGLSSTEAHSGTNSYFTNINNTSSSSVNINLTLLYATPQNMSGAQITMYVWVDTSLVNSTDWITDIQPFYLSAITNWNGNWHKMNKGADDARWVPVTINVSPSDTAVTAIGLQMGNVPAGASGNVYVDDVNINISAPTPTPTSTPLPVISAISYEFDGGSVPTGWQTDFSGSAAIGALSIFAPGYDGSAGCLAAGVTFGALNDTVDIFCQYASATDLSSYNISGIRAEVYEDVALSTNPTGSFIWSNSGASWAYQAGTWTNLTAATWTALDFPSPFSDVTQVQKFGIQFGAGGAGTWTGGTALVDAVEFY